MSTRRHGGAWCAFAGFFAVPPAVFGQPTNLTALNAALPDVGFSAFRVLGALIVVLAIFFGGVWLFKNWQRLVVRKGRAPKLNILEVRALGNRHSIYVVAYEQQRMMLASSPAGVTFITHLPNGESEPVPVAAAALPDFAATLQQMLSRQA